MAERAAMFGLWHSSGNTLLDSSHNVLFVRPLAFRRILQWVAYSLQYVRISHVASVHFKNNHWGHYQKLQRNILYPGICIIDAADYPFKIQPYTMFQPSLVNSNHDFYFFFLS